jgi:hypothetical protein
MTTVVEMTSHEAREIAERLYSHSVDNRSTITLTINEHAGAFVDSRIEVHR